MAVGSIVLDEGSIFVVFAVVVLVLGCRLPSESNDEVEDRELKRGVVVDVRKGTRGRRIATFQ